MIIAVNLGDLRERFKAPKIELPEGISSIVLYHGTSSHFQKDIERNGLLPRAVTGNSVYDLLFPSQPHLIYLAVKEIAANSARRAVMKYGGHRILVETNAEVKLLCPDEDAERFHNVTCWQDSLRVAGTCGYLGKSLQAQAIHDLGN